VYLIISNHQLYFSFCWKKHHSALALIEIDEKTSKVYLFTTLVEEEEEMECICAGLIRKYK
jgi:hypothetical protein